MNSLTIVLGIKIVFTALLWCILLLLFPESLLIQLGLPEPSTMLFLRLLGMAYLALVVGYCFGLSESLKGGHPLNIVWVGIISNGGACLILLINGILKIWQDWGLLAQVMMWLSLAVTGGITIGLIFTGLSDSSVPDSKKSNEAGS